MEKYIREDPVFERAVFLIFKTKTTWTQYKVCGIQCTVWFDIPEECHEEQKRRGK